MLILPPGESVEVAGWICSGGFVAVISWICFGEFFAESILTHSCKFFHKLDEYVQVSSLHFSF